MPRRFQHHHGAFKPPNSRIVTRPSRFGTPFRLAPGEHGDPAAHARIVAQFREWITAPGRAGLLSEACRELRGLDLGCYCPVDLPCHADVLLDLVNRE